LEVDKILTSEEKIELQALAADGEGA
jgi:hypothetical protein